jgi:hypothetical protein
MSKIIGEHSRVVYCEDCGRICDKTLVNAGYDADTGKKIYRFRYICPKTPKNALIWMFSLNNHTERIGLDVAFNKTADGDFIIQK